MSTTSESSGMVSFIVYGPHLASPTEVSNKLTSKKTVAMRKR